MSWQIRDNCIYLLYRILERYILAQPASKYMVLLLVPLCRIATKIWIFRSIGAYEGRFLRLVVGGQILLILDLEF